ncbi:PREDICTED: uncharacterized protein LOC101303433 [Fragaria vesca subsp. vesca]|uniref:uncharacterized protein LOC101303433 n=1 Tax=Fragaria vesca subsp. vesca TaxID=101020 RepID=UPI0002C314BB|nr:PREDICTED: uncharacterized protein LOC101303433 [Fragaria vesca subsp. vesca]
MECNKDEAIRAKEIAERKFAARDVMGAKKFAVKAQNLFPGLDGIPQLMAALDVLVAAEIRINGEVDWYGMLGLDPRADDETVKRQYKKLALMLHPDKNKAIGAEGAFKLLSEAWSLLSDKGRRKAYDQRRTANGSTSHFAAGANNGFYNFTKSSTSGTKKPPPKSSSSSRAARSSAPPPASVFKPKASTFWTVCHKCRMQYEYMRVYLNHNLLCPNCHEAFFAVEIDPPPTGAAKSSTSWNPNHDKSSFNTGRSRDTGGAAGFTESYHQNNFQWGPFSKSTGASSAAQAASVVQQAYEKAKREREEAQAANKKEEALRRKHQPTSKKVSGASSNAAKKRKGMDDFGGGSIKPPRDVPNQVGGVAGAANFFGPRQLNFESGRVNGTTKFSITRDLSVLEVQSILVNKARKELLRKLNEQKSETAVKQAGNGKETEKSLKNVDVLFDQNKSGVPVDKKNGASERKHSGTSSDTADAETLEAMTITVPDSDFHDFDRDRTEESFGENQVWAAYDGDDGMPRYYAIIHSVISLNPFKVRISWLNSRTNSELGPLNWVASGFAKTCGDFRVGKYEINKSLNSFSHKVRWTKGARGIICIYPKKGDVWALYRNWSPDWNELTADEVKHKYDMVEVVEDYNEELGVTVTPLVKVAGFKSVFHRHLDPREVRRIPREEMFRFSHQIPSYLHTGLEASNAPKGCRELDPAATPLELLQVITDAKDEEIMETDEKPKEVDVIDVDVENTEAEEEEIIEIDEEPKEVDVIDVDVENTNGVEEIAGNSGTDG